jgi:purine-binding chemotaxis protein CheW
MGRLVGMIVDSASEVLKIPANEIETAPAMMQEGGLDCVTGLGKYQGRLIILLDVNRVLAVRNSEGEAKAEKPDAGSKSAATVSAQSATATSTGTAKKSVSAGK